jgi:hypothetical protein
MRLIVVTLCLLLAGCANLSFHRVQYKPKGNLLVSIRKTEGSFTGSVKRDTGYFFYVETEPAGSDPTLTGYHIVDGDIKEEFGGSDSKEVLKAIAAVGLEPFDYQKEVQTVTARFEKEAQQRGEQYIAPMALDGAEYEIIIVIDKGKLSLREWNPGSTIDAYAAYSPKIAKLKKVLDILAQYYGRFKFGV